MEWPAIFCVFLGAAALIDFLRRALRPGHSFRGKHVLVTGGSSGIGKALSAELLARGARVTLLARTETKLVEAMTELAAGVTSKTGTRSSEVRYEVASIADEHALSAAVANATAAFGPIDVLVANAGSAAPGLFLDMPTATFQEQMNLNYMGTVRSIKAVVPAMVQQRRGHVIIIASAAAAISFLGYSAYAPTKHALRGLADALRNELLGFNISVQIAYPPDTKTPGYAHENKSKPPETLAMVPSDVFSAEIVARKLLNSAEAGDYHLYGPDAGQNLLVAGSAGVTPRWLPLIECGLLLPIIGLVEMIVCWWFDTFGRKYAARHDAEALAKKSS